MTNQDKEFIFAFLFFPIITYKNATLNKNMGDVLSLIFRFITFDNLWSNYLVQSDCYSLKAYIFIVFIIPQ
jgi:hypothetical protein